MDLVKHLQSAWKRHSLGSFVQLAVKNVVLYAKDAFSGRLFQKSAVQPSEFDSSLGVDTEEIRELWSLDVDAADNAAYAHRYQPSPHAFATQVIKGLVIDHSRFTFVDFGAGKGRVLLIAAQWPFKAVFGVEFSRELCEIASANLKKIPPERCRAGRVECHHEDALRYALPDGPLVCYFYNPFTRPLMVDMVERLATDLKNNPREVYILYAQTDNRDLFDKQDFWEPIESTDFHVIYRARLDKLPTHA